MSERHERPITLKNTAKNFSKAASAAADYDLRPVLRLIKIGGLLVVVFAFVAVIVALSIKKSAEEKRSHYEQVLSQRSPLSREVERQVREAFRLIQPGSVFDVGKYEVVRSRDEEKAKQLLIEVTAFCEPAGRFYAARNHRNPFHIAFQTDSFEGSVRMETRKCVDDVVRSILLKQ